MEIYTWDLGTERAFRDGPATSSFYNRGAEGQEGEAPVDTTQVVQGRARSKTKVCSLYLQKRTNLLGKR